MYLPFFAAPNLSVRDRMVEAQPWAFRPEPERLSHVRALKKEARRLWAAKPDTQWQCYSAVGGLNPAIRVGKDNQARVMHGVVIDYDAITTIPTIAERLRSELDVKWHPQFIEITLGGKVRLVWVFEEPLYCMDSRHAEAILERFVRELRLGNLLAGFDAASTKPSQVWTNGGEWHPFEEKPVAKDLVIGVAVDAKFETSAVGEIPLEIIAAKVEKDYPGRFGGEFKLDALGMRFWDPKADNKGGCQVKLDGMLCFTDTVPFRKWADIFGHEWVRDQRKLNLGTAAKDIYFDGRAYYEKIEGLYQPVARHDIVLHLHAVGISNRAAKGRFTTDADDVLHFIQHNQRVYAATPIVHLPHGPVTYKGTRFLNTVNLVFPRDIPGPVVLERDCPFLYPKLQKMFADFGKSWPHFEAWLALFLRAQRNHRIQFGQIVFLCGAPHSGKSFLVQQWLCSLTGGRVENPYRYLTGRTQFNTELLGSPLWSVDDQESPRSHSELEAMISALKGASVSPNQRHEKKFSDGANAPWNGRVIFTLNDEPEDRGILPEPKNSTRDKFMFFKVLDGAKNDFFSSNAENEMALEAELPAWRWHFLNCPLHPDVVERSRMGVRSYYDKDVLDQAIRQSPSATFRNLLGKWISEDAFWQDGKQRFADFRDVDLGQLLLKSVATSEMASGWKPEKIRHSLLSLSRVPGSGVELMSHNPEVFRLHRELLEFQKP